MKLSTLGMAGISALLGLAFMSAVIAAEPSERGKRPAFASDRGPGPGGNKGRFGRGRGPGLEQQLKRLDANEDGKISEAEFVDSRLAHIDELFERRDRNNDGLIALDEDKPERPGRPNRPDIDRADVIACVRETIADFAPNADVDIADHFETVDTDGNGSVTLAELSTAIEQRATQTFARIDADGDGFITEEELAAHHEDQRNTARTIRECVRKIAQA